MASPLSTAKDLAARGINSVHQTVFRVSNGRVANRFFGMPAVMLTTTGRKSGKKRTTMLTSPLQDGDTVVLVASYGGDARHPAWYLNLRDEPQVEIVMDGRRRGMVARTATPAEKADLWPRVTSKYKGYSQYQRWTDRDIPLVILEPA